MPDNLHNTEYYTGAQVRIYFGHIFIDEITSIEWNGSSTKRPVYGYASTQFDAIAKGQYIVQGQFLMPFKEVGYLDAVRRELTSTSQYIDRITKNLKNSLGQDRATVTSDYGSRVSVTVDGNGQKRVTALTLKDILTQEASDGGKQFNETVNGLEEQLWGQSGTPVDIRRVDEFDMEGTFVRSGFNILLTFGDVNNPNTPSTIRTIIDVHLTGSQTAVDSSDNTVYEQYSFFARGTDESVGSYQVMSQGNPLENFADVGQPGSGGGNNIQTSVRTGDPLVPGMQASGGTGQEQRTTGAANTGDSTVLDKNGNRQPVDLSIYQGAGGQGKAAKNFDFTGKDIYLTITDHDRFTEYLERISIPPSAQDKKRKFTILSTGFTYGNVPGRKYAGFLTNKEDGVIIAQAYADKLYLKITSPTDSQILWLSPEILKFK